MQMVTYYSYRLTKNKFSMSKYNKLQILLNCSTLEFWTMRILVAIFLETEINK